MMKAQKLAWLAGLAFILLGCVGTLQAQQATGTTGGSHLLKGKPEPYLEIRTPNGSMILKLFGEDDGPVRIPVGDPRLSALFLSSELTAKGVKISLGAEEGELKVSPMGRYELKMGDEMALQDLDALGVQGWSMKLSMGSLPYVIDDCCACGRLNCCPLPGKCLACSSCGSCCGSGRPEV